MPEDFFEPALLKKYNMSGPRYTSYPTALEFKGDFKQDDLLLAIENSPNRQLSLYIHIPFCHSLCYYCGCNKIVTRHSEKADVYLQYLAQEINSRAALFSDYTVIQLHLGGGTPSFLSQQQLSYLLAHLQDKFAFAAQCEMSIEIDPREIPLDLADHLADIGFNRLSIGVQDIDPKVQKAINRQQSTDFIEQFVARAKSVGFRSINLDLIYGLPHQTPESFLHTLNWVNTLDVERLSLFSYAHMPSRFAAQRKIRDEWLPGAQEKLALMKLSIETLCKFGYEFIGMDHFAKPDDELAVAQREGKLHRNFQGYTTGGDSDLLGLGVSAISAIGNCFSQNIKALPAYYKQIEQQQDAIEKGVVLSKDDQLRAEVIRELMCNLQVNKHTVEQKFAIDFDDYFHSEIAALAPFIEDDLVCLDSAIIKVNAKARLLVRLICMCFDRYLQQKSKLQQYSRVI
ncbi:MAG: oxygen-independent coproporphyrinogen-3 oxidase [Paraglaciecola sp.]|jgi:oxygen-independent coproporphyrinogen-3 oxidase